MLLRELGVDPADFAARVGLDPGVFRNPENAIPFTAAGKLLQAGGVRALWPPPRTTLGHQELGPRRQFDEERADLGRSAA